MIEQRHAEVSTLIDSLARSQPSYDNSVGRKVYLVEQDDA